MKNESMRYKGISEQDLALFGFLLGVPLAQIPKWLEYVAASVEQKNAMSHIPGLAWSATERRLFAVTLFGALAANLATVAIVGLALYTARGFRDEAAPWPAVLQVVFILLTAALVVTWIRIQPDRWSRALMWPDWLFRLVMGVAIIVAFYWMAVCVFLLGAAAGVH